MLSQSLFSWTIGECRKTIPLQRGSSIIYQEEKLFEKRGILAYLRLTSPFTEYRVVRVITKTDSLSALFLASIRDFALCYSGLGGQSQKERVVNIAVTIALFMLMTPFAALRHLALFDTYRSILSTAVWKKGFPLDKGTFGKVLLGALMVQPEMRIQRNVFSFAEGVMTPRNLSQLSSFFYAVIGAPLLEETIYRGVFYDKLTPSRYGEEKKSLLKKVCLILTGQEKRKKILQPLTFRDRCRRTFVTSLLFGLAHYIPGEGFAGIPRVLGITTSGLVLGGLREVTGDLWASTTMHALHNMVISIGENWLMIDPSVL